MKFFRVWTINEYLEVIAEDIAHALEILEEVAGVKAEIILRIDTM